MAKILIVSAQVHQALSQKQLEACLSLMQQSVYQHEVLRLQAGTYEIPFVINHYHQKKSFDAYIALGLVLKTNPLHLQYISEHISKCFTHFALEGVIVGNGIIYGDSVEELAYNLESPDPCLSAYPSAFRAVSALLNLQ